MASRIEDYALLGDLETAALVSRDGSIDWMCLPRFDSDACFAALLGDRGNGRWTLGPVADVIATRRAYRAHSLVLDTELDTATGTVAITDCMPVRAEAPYLIRIVACTRGEVAVETRLAARFGYGVHRPWTRPEGDRIEITSAPDSLSLWSERPLAIESGDAVGTFVLREGESIAFTLAWHAAHLDPPKHTNPRAAIDDTVRWWRSWADRCTYRGPWRQFVMRSLVTLKALTYAPTGGIVAAPTTSLPERIGGVRNWDYRYCWLRDTALTLSALLDAGYEAEARAFAKWLERAARGEPTKVQILYAVTGEPRITELELTWLAGYEGSKPVRIGNAASEQLQLDVYGEITECFHQARVRGVVLGPEIWAFERALVEHLEAIWREPDHGMWESRGDPQPYTFSKIMAWVAFDRMIKDAEAGSFDGPVEHWKRVRDQIHADVCEHGFDAKRAAFTQVYGKPALDASLLLIAQLGFLPASDPRVKGTVAAIRTDLLHEGLVLRYDTADELDGLPAGEGVFLACSFWLADALDLEGDRDGARTYFEQLLALCNDVGLLSEEYDPQDRRLIGNFPQAFTHIALIRTAIRLGSPDSPTPDEQPALNRSETRSS